MVSTILELEQQDIELQLRGIQLKRRALEIEREKLNNEGNQQVPVRVEQSVVPTLYLHYSDYVKDNHMSIEDVCRDGSILVRHGKNSCTVSKKYSMRTLLWIRQKLPSWVNAQREENHFWDKLADKYSRKFLSNGESISRTTMKKLCFLVDSGKADVWFDKYDSLKGNGKQSTLDGA